MQQRESERLVHLLVAEGMGALNSLVPNFSTADIALFEGHKKGLEREKRG